MWEQSGKSGKGFITKAGQKLKPLGVIGSCKEEVCSAVEDSSKLSFKVKELSLHLSQAALISSSIKYSGM